MSKPTVDDTGRLNIDSVNNMSRDELEEWVEARLHSSDTIIPGDFRQGDYPHYLHATIYPELNRDSRSYMRHITRRFLRDMSRNSASNWRGDAADALLLLAQNLGEREFIDPIREMAESYQFLDGRNDHIHRRLLQTLVKLNWRGEPEFWHEQVARAPIGHAGVAFAGLALIALPHAINLLPYLQLSEHNVQGQIRVALRGLLPAHDHSHIGRLLEDVMPHLPSSSQDMILEFVPEVRIFIRPRPKLNTNSAREVLTEFGFSNKDFESQNLIM